MAHLVPQHRTQLLTSHLLHDLRGDCHERAVLEGARSERVRLALVDRHFRHLHIRALSRRAHSVDKPSLALALFARDRARTHRPLCNRLREEKRNETARHAVHERPERQRLEVEPRRLVRLGGIHSEKRAHNVEHHRHRQHDGEVRGQEQEYSFHLQLPFICQASRGWARGRRFFCLRQHVRRRPCTWKRAQHPPR